MYLVIIQTCMITTLGRSYIPRRPMCCRYSIYFNKRSVYCCKAQACGDVRPIVARLRLGGMYGDRPMGRAVTKTQVLTGPPDLPMGLLKKEKENKFFSIFIIYLHYF